MARRFLIGAACMAAFMVVPAQAGGLLGLGGGNDNLVNIEIGGDHLAHVNTGGGLAPTVDADIRLLGNDGVANVQVGAGGFASVGVSVGNDGIGACVSVLSNGCGSAVTGPGGPNGPGGPTGPGGPKGPGGALGSAGKGAVCAGTDDQRALGLLNNRYDASVFSGWARARQIRLVLVKPCPALRARLSEAIKASAKMQRMQQAVAHDALIAATLDRNGVRPVNVLGVDGRGGALSVYVY